MTGITDMVPGDYVKIGTVYKEIRQVYGVSGKKLSKPSEGFFGVICTDGHSYSGWKINRYLKRSEVPEDKLEIGTT